MERIVDDFETLKSTVKDEIRNLLTWDFSFTVLGHHVHIKETKNKDFDPSLSLEKIAKDFENFKNSV
jgi:hypothetical protein